MTSILEYNKEEEERKIGEARYEQGREQGDAERLCKLINKFALKNDITVEKACEMMDVSLDEYRNAERLVKKNDR